MSKDTIDFSTEKPKMGGKLYGAFRAVSVNAQLMETKTDKTGKEYHKIFVDFQFDPNVEPPEEGKELPTKRIFIMLPYDYWKDGSTGEPVSLFRQLCDATKKKFEDFKGEVSKKFVGLDVTILIGAQRHWKTKEIEMWGDNGDKINYGIVGILPATKFKSAWTKEMEENEIAIAQRVKGGNVEPKKEEEASFEDVQEAFDPKVSAKKDW